MGQPRRLGLCEPVRAGAAMTAVMASLVYLTLRQILRTLTSAPVTAAPPGGTRRPGWRSPSRTGLVSGGAVRVRERVPAVVDHPEHAAKLSEASRPKSARGPLPLPARRPRQISTACARAAAEAGVLGNDRRDAAQPNNRRCARFRK